MAHSEAFMDDPQSSTVFEAKGLWKQSFKSLYEFYQHKLLCDVEIEVRLSQCQTRKKETSNLTPGSFSL